MNAREAYSYIQGTLFGLRYLTKTLVSQKDHDALGVLLDGIELSERKEMKNSWHDLEKNPNDLPEKFKHIILKFKTIKGGYDAYYTVFTSDSFLERISDNNNAFYRYVAWRYFDAYDEVEE